MIKIERLGSFNDLGKDTWNSLLDYSRQNYIFQTFEFQSIWWKHFGERSGSKNLLLLAAREDNNIIGIAPLMTEETRILRKPVIKFVGTPICDYMDFIILKDKEKEVARSFYAYLKNLKCLEINLVFIPEKESSASSTLMTKNVLIDACPYIDLDGTWEIMYSRLNKTVKKYVLRREQNISKIGSLRFGFVENKEEIEDFLEEYFRMHIKRWRQYAKKYSQFQYSFWRNFVKELAYELFAKNFINFSYLKLNSNMISSHFGFVYNKIFHWYMPAYNPDYSKYSPGHILIMYLLKYSIQNGLTKFDFLRGTEPHKMFWTDKTENLFNCLAYSNYYALEQTGHLIRKTKNFYFRYIKKGFKKVTPLMRLWYKIKSNE